jgi:hypothetical protein
VPQLYDTTIDLLSDRMTMITKMNSVRTNSVIDFLSRLPNPSSQIVELTPDEATQAAKQIEDRWGTQLKSWLDREPEPSAMTLDRAAKIREHTDRLLPPLVQAHTRRCDLALQFKFDPTAHDGLSHLQTKRNYMFWRIFRINDLPHDVIGHIFRYVAMGPGSSELAVTHRFNLTWVCRLWRSVMIADITMWSSIWFTDEPPYERSFTWFERASTAPLDLRISEPEPCQCHRRFTGEDMEWLMQRLFVKLEQIRMLIVTVDTWPPALAILDLLRHPNNIGRARSLERFELHRVGVPWVWIGPGFTPDRQRNPIPLCGNNAPRLNYVCLNGVHVDWANSPFVGLRTLDLRRMALEASPTLAQFHYMLRNCPNLYKLTLDGCGPNLEPTARSGELERSEPAVLPKLIILVLGDVKCAYANYVLSHISAPNVRDMTLMNLNGEEYSEMAVKMTGMFPEVQLLTLYTVEMGGPPHTRRSIVRWLHSMPKLRYIRAAAILPHMLHIFLHDPRMYSVGRSPGSQDGGRPVVLAPKLEIFEFQFIDLDAVIAFGEGRRAIGAPLKKIYVNAPFHLEIDAEGQRRLRSIAKLYVSPVGADTKEEMEILAA